MNDFMRVALYDAVHNIIPIIKNSKKIKVHWSLLAQYVTTCKFIKYNKYQKLNQSITSQSQMLELMVLLYHQTILNL